MIDWLTSFVQKNRISIFTTMVLIGTILPFTACVGVLMVWRIQNEPRPQANQNPVVEPERVTRANYNRIRIGMDMREVEDILGFGTEDARGQFTIMAHWTSRDGRTTIRITFDSNLVASKSIFP